MRQIGASLRTLMPLGSDSFWFLTVICNCEDVCVRGDLTQVTTWTADMLGVS